MAVPLGARKVGLNIWFHSCFPAVLRDTAYLEEVGLLALPTIDPRAPHHFMATMHAAYSPFRAAELGVPVVRADCGAYSSIVDARGRILAEAPFSRTRARLIAREGAGDNSRTATAAVNRKSRRTSIPKPGRERSSLFACSLRKSVVPYLVRGSHG